MANEDDRVPWNTYPALLPYIRQLVVHYGVSTSAISEVFGLRRKTITSRMGEMEAFREREIRDRQVAEKMLYELIRTGVVPQPYFRQRLSEKWKGKLDSDEPEAVHITPGEG